MVALYKSADGTGHREPCPPCRWLDEGIVSDDEISYLTAVAAQIYTTAVEHQVVLHDNFVCLGDPPHILSYGRTSSKLGHPRLRVSIR